jgi:hypothetical protein
MDRLNFLFIPKLIILAIVDFIYRAFAVARIAMLCAEVFFQSTCSKSDMDRTPVNDAFAVYSSGVLGFKERTLYNGAIFMLNL